VVGARPARLTASASSEALAQSGIVWAMVRGNGMAFAGRAPVMLKLAGLVLLVALILVGALLPLKYTARMHLPKRPPDTGEPGRADHDPARRS